MYKFYYVLVSSVLLCYCCYCYYVIMLYVLSCCKCYFYYVIIDKIGVACVIICFFLSFPAFLHSYIPLIISSFPTSFLPSSLPPFYS